MKSVARVALPLFLALACPLAAQQSKQPAPATGAAPSAVTNPVAPETSKPAPYDNRLMRLAEILGSISYLRTLCGAPQEDWRTSMRQLLDSDATNEPARRERLTAAYNRGYRSFASLHTTCSDSARLAEERYRAEGATLATEIAARFGN